MTPIARRSLVGSALALPFAGRARAQALGAIRLGLLTVKTGPLASGGIQMEQGLALWLKENGNRMAGRSIELFAADTGGVPANTRSKTQELVERSNVSAIIGPLAAFEALAIDDYTKEKGIPVFSIAAAEDITQRHPDPWFCRVTSSSAQCAQPLADYARKELGYKAMATIGDDIAYGQEQNAGFQRVFEDMGGRIVQKLWPPLNAPDYGTFVAQLKEVDGIFMSFAGSNGFRFFKQFKEYGGSTPILGGMTAVDEAVLQQMGADAVGMISASWYSAQLGNPSNKRFVAGMQAEYKADPGYYAAGTYVAAQVMDAALRQVDGRIEDKQAFMKAVRDGSFPETARGPVRFDQYGNVVGNVYVRKVEKQGGRFVNAVVKTYPDVSQFWTYDPAEFLKQPVYARDSPPARFLNK